MSGRWPMLFASSFAFITYAFALQLVPPLMHSIIQEFGLTQAQAGLLMSSVMVPGVILALPAGVLVDRYGVRRIGSIATALIAIGTVITAAASSFDLMLAGRFILGTGGALISVSVPTLIPRWFPPEQLGRAMGIYGMNMPLASIAAFLSASALAISHGWQSPLHVSALLALLNMAVFVLIVRDGPKMRNATERQGVRRVISNAEIWKLGVAWFFFSVAAISFTTWTPKIFQESRGMDPISASLSASSLMLVSIPLAPTIGLLSDKTGKRKLFMTVGASLMAASILAVGYTSGLPMIASVAFLGVTAALVPPIVLALPSVILGPSLAGTGFGIVTVCSNTGIALGPPFIGLLMDATGSQTSAFLGMALAAALCAVVSYGMRADGPRD